MKPSFSEKKKEKKRIGRGFHYHSLCTKYAIIFYGGGADGDDFPHTIKIEQ